MIVVFMLDLHEFLCIDELFQFEYDILSWEGKLKSYLHCCREVM